MIKIKLEDGAHLPIKKTPGAACYDLYSNEEKVIHARNYDSVNLGIRSEFDDSIVAKIFDRSGIALKGIFITAGIIDSDYRGIWKVLMYNMSDVDFVIRPGDRIAQVMFLFLAPVGIVSVSEVGISYRNEGGFGSTGKS